MGGRNYAHFLHWLYRRYEVSAKGVSSDINKNSRFNTTLQAKVSKLGCCGKKDEKENVKLDAQNGDVTTSLMHSGNRQNL